MWGKRKEAAEKEDKSYVKVCPRCGSRKIFMEPGVSIYILLGWIYQYRCKECNYFGPNFLLAEENSDKTILKPEE